MKDELHRHPNGEMPTAGPGSGRTQQADAWGRLLEAFREEMRSTPPPPWLESKVMAEIEGLPEPGRISRLGRWLIAPRPIRVPPLWVGVAAAAVVALLFFGRPQPPGFVQTPANGAVVYVQFVLDAPGAQSVAVAGDFDEWIGSHSLEDGDGDGIWTGRVPLQPGVHAYMFLVDGATWLTDPRAERYSEDGFGNRNAILAVAAPSA
ncbi:MAG: glycoside hydrolase family 13 [Gemmatimonadetes bacterium]|nr:glycogen-binding domain-containing protein [Gemmatimonadota bacterium]NNM06117.1 glycoside hydrolase family 13 [Gemmatimonadota bacterium]